MSTEKEYIRAIRWEQLQLIDVISHSIAQNQIADKNYDVDAYVAWCKEFMSEYLDADMIDDLVTQGRELSSEHLATWAMGFNVAGHGASATKPAIQLETGCIKLRGFVQLLNHLRKEVNVHVEEAAVSVSQT